MAPGFKKQNVFEYAAWIFRNWDTICAFMCVLFSLLFMLFWVNVGLQIVL